MITQVAIKDFRCLHDIDVSLGAFNVLVGQNRTGKTSFLGALLSLAYGTCNDSWMTYKLAEDVPFASFAANINYYAFNAGSLARDSLSLAAEMTPSGHGLPLVLFRARQKSDEINRGLRSVFPDILSYRIDLRQEHEQSVYSLEFEIKGYDQLIPAYKMSSGVLLILGYLALAYTAKPGIVLIENPENGIHIRLLCFVTEVLRGLSRGIEEGAPPVQVIITTHSPYLLDHIDAKEVLMFCRPKENGNIFVKCVADTLIYKTSQGDLLLGELFGTWDDEDFFMEEI